MHIYIHTNTFSIIAFFKLLDDFADPTLFALLRFSRTGEHQVCWDQVPPSSIRAPVYACDHEGLDPGS